MNNLTEMAALIAACSQDLREQELFQWDESYPNRVFFQEAIAEGHAHVLWVQNRIAGLVVLDEWQHSSWEAIAWEPAGSRALVVHSFAIHPHFQGQRLGSALLECCEAWAVSHGFDTLRLDVFAENQAAIRLYQRHGYRLQGRIVVPGKPAGHQDYDCYQKRI